MNDTNASEPTRSMPLRMNTSEEARLDRIRALMERRADVPEGTLKTAAVIRSLVSIGMDAYERRVGISASPRESGRPSSPSA